jgi:hypothetical protein
MRRPSSAGNALAAALRDDDYERAALLLLVAFAEAARRLGEGDIDDLLALLAKETRSDDRPPRR